MRLEDDVNLVESALPRSGQGGANLGGMMTVIVHHGDSVNFAFELKATIYAAKLLEGFCNFLRRDIKSNTSGDGSSGIEHIVLPGNVQIELADFLIAIHH